MIRVIKNRTYALSIYGGFVTCMGLLVCNVSAAGDPNYVSAPQNGRCAPSYQHRGGSMCVPLVVPVNAHVDASGHDWNCNAGYRKKGKICERLKAPDAMSTSTKPRKIATPPMCSDHGEASGGGRSSDMRIRCD